MAEITELKSDIEFISGLGEIIDVFKSAAMIQFTAFGHKKSYFDKYGKYVDEIADAIALGGYKTIFEVNQNKPKIIVLVTSDAGFLGELNTVVVNAGLEVYKPEDRIYVLGSKGSNYLDGVRVEHVKLPGIDEKVSFAPAAQIAKIINEDYPENIGSAVVFYPQFISLNIQRLGCCNLLPINKDVRENKTIPLLIEPNEKEISKMFVRLYAANKLANIFFESKQAELAARIIHLENSTEQMGEINKKLKKDYFKQMHSINDKNIREVSAVKLMKKK